MREEEIIPPAGYMFVCLFCCVHCNWGTCVCSSAKGHSPWH